jgi:FMN-dependent NADH-azoreductase
VLARGGAYGEGAPAAALEHAETYLKGVLAFIGVKAPEFVVAEGLAFGDEARHAAISGATDRARLAASDLLQAA